MIVMITENGPHPPQKWAETTASQIIDIGAQARGTSLQEARDLQVKLVNLLTEHHAAVQETERANLTKVGHKHLNTPFNTDPHVQKPVDAIIALARDTSFQKHFEQPQVRAYLEGVLKSHFASSMHVERLHHCDRNPNVLEAMAYRAKHHPADKPVNR